MRLFRERVVTAVILAASILVSIASPVFAEGSKEFNEVPEKSNVSAYPAHRPYFEWRERSQFGEAGKNVVYVYAKKGETIFFGSDVTTASDRSIEAIVHPEEVFTNTISSSNKDWAGSSIAVTLPTSDKKVAFNPEQKDWYDTDEIENLFLDGHKQLVEGCDPEKVYLFKPTPSGKGHILTPMQEENGPNGVIAKDAAAKTMNGYEPLSFVAPVEGTYSFRFLARDYRYADDPQDDLTLTARNESTGITKEIAAIKADKDGYMKYRGDDNSGYANEGNLNGNSGIIQTSLTGWSSRNGYVGFDLGDYSAEDFDKAYLRMNIVDANGGGKMHFYWLDYGDWTRGTLPSDSTVLDAKKMPTHITSKNLVSFEGYQYQFEGDVTGLGDGAVFNVDITDSLKEYIADNNPSEFTLAILSEETNTEYATHTQFASINNTTYAGPQIILAEETHATEADNSELSPVAESYTWDFANMKGGAAYTNDTIVGYYPVDATGTDYDSSYYYDLKVYATENGQVKINDGALSFTGTFDNSTGSESNAIEMLPAWNGTVEVSFENNGAAVCIWQPLDQGEKNYNATQTGSVIVNVAKGKPVYIYASAVASIKSIKYTVTEWSEDMLTAARDVDEQWSTSLGSLVSAWDITVADANYNAQPGRVWSDRFVLNAGGFQKSIYPRFKVLTREGFLYDVKLNGVQPWAFSFYSNNRGFLLDRWSLYSNPQLAYGDENAKPSTELVQALEHSFLSLPTGNSGDIGPAPIHKEVDGDGRPVMNKGNQMESTILGNYIPVDSEKDITHKMFFNVPDEVAVKAYTEKGEIKRVKNADEEYSGLLNDIEYIGLGNFADNESSDIHYGTIGIGGQFEVTISAEEAKQLDALGSSSISILLDFSGYSLKPDKNGVPVPVLDGNKKWQEITGTKTKDEENNLVSLSVVIDNDATEPKTYTLSWDGRDAYGNVVPQGEYTQVIKSFVEMGMAHFPILDAEHNPNGIKIKMLNEIDGHDKKDYVYYNNEAVSPKKNPDDPSAWYYAGGDDNNSYPSKIGDGLNRIGGVSTDFDNSSTYGAMKFGSYSGEDGNGDRDQGYGNSAALDIWSKYEIKSDAELVIGVNPIEAHKSYVSFVATDGTAGIPDTPFVVSHVRYADEINEEYKGNKGRDDIYGNTISTGFITHILTTAEGIANDRLIWEITIPAAGKFKENDVKEHASYIKIPTDDINSEEATLTTQADADEAEYLSYELFTGLFEEYIDAGYSGVDLGEEFMPDWEADAGFDSDEEPGIMDIPGSAESAEVELYEEMYFEEMELAAVEAGDYKDNDWSVTVNVSPEAVMEDAEEVVVNKGNIHKINTFKISDTETNDYVTVKVAHKLPIITGGSAISVGLVIDNLYSPAATATAKYSSSGWESLHEITSILFGGSNADSVQASSHDEYSTSSRNEYNLEGYGQDDNLAIGLVMHITFDESNTGTGSFTATRGGTVKENNDNGSITYGEGKHGKAVSMTGKSNDFLELPQGIFYGSTSASVSFWLKQGDSNSNGWAFMTTPISLQKYKSEKYLGILLASGKDKITAERYYSNDQDRPQYQASAGGSFGEWNYITVVYEPESTTIYVNGEPTDPVDSKAQLSNIFTAKANTWIGHANWGSGEGFAGMIDDFRIYNRALGADEIKILMTLN